MQTAPNASWQVTGPEIFEISGRLDSDNALTVAGDVALCIKGGARELVLDCSQLETITGAGMRAFLIIAKTMKDAHGKMVVSGLQPQVKAMFDACGYEFLVPVFDSTEIAATALAV